jgi:ribosomal-protein-alanine N-acetyltransferase
LLEGKNVNLRVVEKEDLPLLAEWFNRPEVFGEYNPLRQTSRTEFEKILEGPNELKPFFIEKKDGGKIGFIAHFYVPHVGGKLLEVGYSLLPDERGKGYCTEALEIMVDYLFLSRDSMRVQAITDVRNAGSQKVLGKAGFKKEGTLRKLLFMRGDWRDAYVYSILREEWKEPKMLTRTKAES